MARLDGKRDFGRVIEWCHRGFQLEGVLNVVSGSLLTFWPSYCMRVQGLPADVALANFNMAQFGSLVLLLGFAGLRVTYSTGIVEALLFGDILWMFVWYKTTVYDLAYPLQHWTPGAHFSFW
eukprot:CAMPEP_0119123592 /NCGR_PEP_ID=MMETSP1310-20130426/3491_1 /TAXON_ID=464262 /ORGANISM="Genus nov. species nov., Strain RCC2339" /LENGTH=121 /DNA_ID=CAMNT_0007113435 /DNA_START=1 /DNA_END=363 /DNA_ORIENTATION=+